MASRTREREDRVVALRLAGMDFQSIAEQVGFRDRSAAWKAYHRALQRRSEPDEQSAAARRAEDLQLELARLDELQARLWSRAMRGDLAAHDRILKIMKHRDHLKRLAAAAHRHDAAPEQSPAGGVVVGPDKLDELRAKRAAD